MRHLEPFHIASSPGFLPAQDGGEATRIESDSLDKLKPFIGVHSQAGGSVSICKQGQRWCSTWPTAFGLAGV